MRAEVRDGYMITPRGVKGRAMMLKAHRLAARGGFVIRVIPKIKYGALDIDSYDPCPKVDWEPIFRPFWELPEVKRTWAAWGQGGYVSGLPIELAITMAEKAVGVIRAAGGEAYT